MLHALDNERYNNTVFRGEILKIDISTRPLVVLHLLTERDDCVTYTFDSEYGMSPHHEMIGKALVAGSKILRIDPEAEHPSGARVTRTDECVWHALIIRPRIGDTVEIATGAAQRKPFGRSIFIVERGVGRFSNIYVSPALSVGINRMASRLTDLVSGLIDAMSKAVSPALEVLTAYQSEMKAEQDDTTDKTNSRAAKFRFKPSGEFTYVPESDVARIEQLLVDENFDLIERNYQLKNGW